MRGIKLLIALIAVFVLGSCKTTREYTETKSQVVESVQNDLTTTEDSSSTVRESAAVVETTTVQDSRVIEETVVELSEPDSSGAQFPVKITTRKEVGGRQTQKRTEAASDSTAVTETTKTTTDNGSKQTTTEVDTSSKVVTKRTPIRLPVAIVVVLLVIPVLRYFRKPISMAFKQAFNWIKNCLKLLKSE